MNDDDNYYRAILAGCYWAGRENHSRFWEADSGVREQTVHGWLDLDHDQWDRLTHGERADRISKRIDNERSLAEGTPELLVDDLISTVVSNGPIMTPHEIDDFYSLDIRLWELLLSQNLQELLPSRDVLSRGLDDLEYRDDSPMCRVEFEGKCNLPGDWLEGEYDVEPNRWFREMFALRVALAVNSDLATSSASKLQDGQLVQSEDVPNEFRVDGVAVGEPFTPQQLKKLHWELTPSYITEAYNNKDILTTRIEVRTTKRGRNPFAYLYLELLALREHKTDREDRREK